MPAWQYAALDCLALAYFYRRWSAPHPQHRQFHFLLMCSYLITTAFYAYQVALHRIAPDALMMSKWWFQLFSNVLYALELFGITVYALLFRRAKADRAQWRRDVEGWMDGIGSAKQAVRELGRKRRPRSDER